MRSPCGSMTQTPCPAWMSDAIRRWSRVVFPMPVLPRSAKWRNRSSGRMPIFFHSMRNFVTPISVTLGCVCGCGRSRGGERSRLRSKFTFGACTPRVGGCQRAATSSVDNRNRGHQYRCSRNRARGPLNMPKLPAISRSFARSTDRFLCSPATLILSDAEYKRCCSFLCASCKFCVSVCSAFFFNRDNCQRFQR